MVFWMGILVGGLFAWLAVKIGFYETWAMVFNIIVAVYLAVFLGPVIVEFFPGADETSYGTLLSMLCIAAGGFLILHCISYTFLTGQFSVSFPGIFNTLGAALLGFVGGFLVWSFVIVLICTTPICRQPIMKGLGFCGPSQESSLSNICWWCDLVHKAAGSEENKITSEEVITPLLRCDEEEQETSEPNEPANAEERNVQEHSPADRRSHVS